MRFIKHLLELASGRKSSSPMAVEPTVIARSDHAVSRADISHNALKVLKRLAQAGYSAYLVGGSVRDLLLRHKPKDFDVVTDAHPQQIRKLFRNCRLIGRRFPLAHIHFQREIVEVATFRARESGVSYTKKSAKHAPEPPLESLFGSIEEDALRRDFTINALYYRLADFAILDFTQGFQDLQQRIIRLIGNPKQRYHDDPVRILRAVRFAAKLNFTLAHETAAAIPSQKHLLRAVPTSRLFDEVLKLFHSGYASRCFPLLQHYQLLEYLIPNLTQALAQDNGHHYQHFITLALENTDARIHEDKPTTYAFVLAVLLWPNVQYRRQQHAALPYHTAFELAISETLQQQARATSIPRRFSHMIREIWLLQTRLTKRAPRRVMALYHHQRFRAAFDFLWLRAKAGDAKPAIANWWQHFQEVTAEEQAELIDRLRHANRKRRR